MRVIGIDYSMTSPAACVWDDSSDFRWPDLFGLYLTDKKKFVGQFGEITGVLHKEHSCPEERFDQISQKFADLASPGDLVFLEGYAFGASGLVFHIGECTGMLKHKLWRKGAHLEVVQPSALKKHATGKGNADKQAMDEAFKRATGLDLKARLGCAEKQWNPSSDVVDAFFLCRLGVQKKFPARLEPV